MHLGKPAEIKWKRIVWGILAGLAFFFLLYFYREIVWLFGFAPPTDQQAGVLDPLKFVVYNCLAGFGFVFFIWLILISFQALLPVSSVLKFDISSPFTFEKFLRYPVEALLEVYRTAWHLLFYILHLHGPAIFIKDGVENASSEDLKRDGIGVVVVDYNSAVVLEECNPPPGLAGALDHLWLLFLQSLMIIDPPRSPRVSGAGIIFTRPRERIRGAVDLRTQFRMQQDVPCYTREGIELKSGVFVLFTVGQDPDVLQVTYVGEKRPENLRVVSVETNAGQWVVKEISENPDELDEADRREIHTYYSSLAQSHSLNGLADYYPPPGTSDQVYHAERVFNAVFAQARNRDQQPIPWMDLPARVAAGYYREILSQVNYDQLYDIREKEKSFPLKQYKSRLRLKTRNNGILSFRLVLARSQRDLVKNRVYGSHDLCVSEVNELKNPKTLRDRGIKVTVAGFGDLIPVNNAIYQQRLDTWKAAWERDEEVTLATLDLRAMRIRSQAHNEAQRDLWYSLSQILNNNVHTDEGLALRVLQALEAAAEDPKTRALLPEQTVNILRHLHYILVARNTTPTNPSGGVP
jgi:hypothetical protein